MIVRERHDHEACEETPARKAGGGSIASHGSCSGAVSINPAFFGEISSALPTLETFGKCKTGGLEK